MEASDRLERVIDRAVSSKDRNHHKRAVNMVAKDFRRERRSPPANSLAAGSLTTRSFIARALKGYRQMARRAGL